MSLKERQDVSGKNDFYSFKFNAIINVNRQTCLYEKEHKKKIG